MDNNTCQICKETKDNLVIAKAIPKALLSYIKKKHVELDDDGHICLQDITGFKENYLNHLITKETDELNDLDSKLEQEIKEKCLLAKNMDIEFDKKRTFGERVADRVASFGGSWTFIGFYLAFLAIWISINVIIYETQDAFDPFPFTFLNLVLAVITTLEAPIIMMSQNRQSLKDSRKAEHDYLLDLEAELELNALHDKIDHLIIHQVEHFVQNQEMLAEIKSIIETKNK